MINMIGTVQDSTFVVYRPSIYFNNNVFYQHIVNMPSICMVLIMTWMIDIDSNDENDANSVTYDLSNKIKIIEL